MSPSTRYIVITLLLTACHTGELPNTDKPAASTANETTADDSGPTIAPRGWTPPAPTQTPPDPSDTLTWTEYYAGLGFRRRFSWKAAAARAWSRLR